MTRDDAAIRVDGLAELRRALRRLDGESLKEVRVVLRAAAEIVAEEARADAPRRSGRLAASIRATTSGNRAVIRASVPYANVIHWGGTTGRGHSRTHPGSVRIQGRPFIYDALERKSEDVARRLASGFDDLFRRNGWT